MRPLAYLVIWMLATVASAQVFLPHRKAAVRTPIATSQTPQLPRTNDIVLWWHSLDLSSSPVSNWTDRIAGKVLQQGTSANRPTWTTNGVAFNGTDQWLDNTNVLNNYDSQLTTNGQLGNSWLFIMQHNTVSSDRMVWATAFAGGQIFLGWDSATKYYSANHGDITCNVTTNTFDMYFTFVNGTYMGYTNGLVWSGVFTNTPLLNAPSLTEASYVGKGGTHFFNGVIKEIIVWTNQFAWTSGEVTQIHAYATNNWGGNP